MSGVYQNQWKKWCSSVSSARQALLRMNVNFLEPSWHPNLSLLIKDRVTVIESTVIKEQIQFRTLAFFDCKENTELLSLS